MWSNIDKAGRASDLSDDAICLKHRGVGVGSNILPPRWVEVGQRGGLHIGLVRLPLGDRVTVNVIAVSPPGYGG